MTVPLSMRDDRPVVVERRTHVTDETLPGRVVQQVVPLANPNPGVERVARSGCANQPEKRDSRWSSSDCV